YVLALPGGAVRTLVERTLGPTRPTRHLAQARTGLARRGPPRRLQSKVWTHDYLTEAEARAAIAAMMDRTGGLSLKISVPFPCHSRQRPTVSRGQLRHALSCTWQVSTPPKVRFPS